MTMDPISQGLRILPADAPLTSSTRPEKPGAGFGSALEDAFTQIDGLQSQAQAQVQNVLSGNGEDLHQAMIAVEKADLSFQLMLQVRNKVVQAYQQIANLQF